MSEQLPPAPTASAKGPCPTIIQIVGRPGTRSLGGGRVQRRFWVNFQCRSVLLFWITVGQGPIALAVGAAGGLFGHFFSHLSFLFSFSLYLGYGPI